VVQTSVIAALLALSSIAVGPSHGDPIAAVVLSLAIILVAAQLGGDLAVRVGQPPVLGELIAGVLIGNLALAGFHGLDFLKTDPAVELLARLGVVLLLFEVGLESTIAQMLSVGLSAFLVACLGVAVPFALGWVVSAWLLPDSSVYVHLFVGATLTATSVGITARVLKDLGRADTQEARIILGAAVIDDVLGLEILAVVSAVIGAAAAGTAVSYGTVTVTLVAASLFLVGALAIGMFVAPRLFAFASRLRSQGVLLATGLSFCFVLSWLANEVGLAAIVGAFAAGLILEPVHYRPFTNGNGKASDENALQALVRPIAGFLTPVFFVLMGLRTDLSTFAHPGILALAAALTVLASAGKIVSGLAAVSRGVHRLVVGVGMIPRGEVGLIFASIGSQMVLGGERVVAPATFSAVVVMVIVTTLVTPPALKWAFTRADAQERRALRSPKIR
jgi:Kef-type K+ transport system membrane component KefB